MKKSVLKLALAGALLVSVTATAKAGERFTQAPFGLNTPAEKCVVCHSIEKNGPHRVAPNLYGIVGAPKARHGEWYGYSAGLFKNGGNWTEEDLNSYLANPSKFAPRTKKSIHVADEKKRQEIIDYLKKLAS